MTAKIIEHKDVSGSKSNKKFYRLVWEDPDGNRGETLNLPADEAAQYPVGSELELVRDPAGKLPSQWAEHLR